MRPRDIATFVAASLLASLLLLPTAAGAAGGGAGMPDPNAPFLHVSSAVMVGKASTATGRLSGTSKGQTIDVQGRRGRTWELLGSGRVASNGTFTARWKAAHVGAYTVRAKPHGVATLASTTTVPSVHSIVHKTSVATWFGPEDNGSQTACGVKLTKTVLGVAHKSLPCGTKVSFYFRGKRITVPVIDRGPYGPGVTWDLTEGTAAALGFTDVGRGKVGAAVLTGEPLANLSKLK